MPLPAPSSRPTPPHVVSVFGVCLFGVVLIADACVFGLCWLGGERAHCRADGVPSAPCGLAAPSTLLSHREHRADRLLQGEHHFLSSSLSLSHIHRGPSPLISQLLISPFSFFHLLSTPPVFSGFHGNRRFHYKVKLKLVQIINQKH